MTTTPSVSLLRAFGSGATTRLLAHWIFLWCCVPAIAFAQTDTTQPTVPTGLAAGAVTINSFNLSWTASTDNVGVTGYEVYRGTAAIGTTAALTLPVTGLAPNTAYAMKVRARDAAGRWSAFGPILSVRTLADTASPTVPAGLVANAVTATGLALAWSATTDNVAVTGYEVFRNGVTLGASAALTRIVVGLAPVTAYTFTVRARDAAGNWSAQSPVLNVTTAPDTTAPAVPVGLASSAITATGFTLRWSAATDNVRVTGYEVFRGGVSVGVTTATSRVFTGLAPAAAYALTVRARDAAGNWSAPSAALTVTTLPDTTAPAVPVGLTASSVTISGFLFRWNAAADNVAVTGYEVFRDDVSVGQVAAPATSLSQTGLALSTPFSLTVRARDAAGNWSAPSAPRIVTTLADTTPPSVPAGLAASAVALNRFTLSWAASTDNVGVTAYEVFRGNVSLGTTPALTLDVTGLLPNTAYSMRVRARDAAGRWSAQSVALVVRTLADTTPPSVPAGLAASGITVTGFTLAWSVATDDVAVTGYEIFRHGVSLGTTAALTRTFTGVAPDTATIFTVRARDKAGNWSELTAPFTVITPPDTTTPAVPAGLFASDIGVTSFKLNWSAATDDVRVTAYEISRDGTFVAATTATNRTLTGLAPETAYIFTVRARDAAGNWSPPAVVLAVNTLPDTTPPAVPGGLVASALTGSGFTLRWSAPKDNVRTALYEVFRDGTSLGTAAATTRNLTGLFPETQYSLTVRAADAAGNWSDLSLPLPVITLADSTAPSVPTALVASSITPTTLTLAWAASADAVGVTLYEVFNGTTSLGSTAALSLPITGLTPNTTYALRARASDAAGNWSAQSTARSVKTLADTVAPSVPEGLAASAITNSTLTLSWAPSTDNVAVTVYEVFRGTVSQGTTPTPSLDLTGLASGTAYTFKVRARDAVGNWSAQSAAVTATTTNDTTPPTAPDGLAATAVALNSLTLVWNAATDDLAVTAYEVYRDGVALGTAAVPSFSVTGLALGTTYSMRVRARDAAGNWSALSAPLAVSPAPDAVAPTAPAGLAAANISATGFTLNWTAATDEVGVTAYEIFINGISFGTTANLTFNVTALPPGGPPYVVTIRARDAAGNWSVIGESLTVTINLVPFFTGFESADGYVPGPLLGQNGWTVDGSAAIVTAPVYRGAQAVAVAPLANLSLVTRQFANTNPGVTFVDVFARPAGGTDPNVGTFFETEAAAVALTVADGVSTLFFFNGNGTGGGDWQAVYPGPVLAADGLTTVWQRLTARLDYTAKRWDLYLDGRMIAADLGFLDNTAASFTSLSLSGHIALTTGFDDVFIGFDNPLFFDADKDGMDDAWELANGLNPALNDRALDLDGDGVSNLFEYLGGTGANIPNTTADTDGDGLPDAWEQQYFGILAYGRAADPGGVGRTLLQSYQQNLSPWPAAPVATGLRLWYRADQGVTRDAAGRVTAWADLSGTGAHAVAPYPGAQPLLVPAAANGKPVVRFDGAENHLAVPGFMAGAIQGELFVVVKVPGYATRDDELWALGGADGTWSDFDGQNRILTEDFGRSYRTAVGVPVTPITDYVIYNVSAQTDDWRVRLNGLPQSAETTNTVVFGNGGALGRATGRFLRGDIAEVIAHDRVLTATERETLGTYLAQKYAPPGITVPAAPTVTATALNSTIVALSWTAPSGPGARAAVERQLGNGPFVAVASAVETSSFRDSALTPGATYTYRVKLTSYAGGSAFVTSAPVTLLAAEAIPTAGQRLWLRADVGALTDAAGNLSTWTDLSPQAQNAKQAQPSARPALVPAAANGKPVVRFDGADDFLNLPAFMAGATAGDLFIVVKIPLFATRNEGPWSLGGQGGAYTEEREGQRTLTEDFGRDFRTPVGAPVAPLTDYVVYNVSARTGEWTVRLNGLTQFTTAQNTVAFSSGPTLGSGPFNGFLQGDIAEVIAYERVLPSAERGQLQTYLGAKFDITALLPDTTPPTVPSGLSVTNLGSRTLTLSWTPSTDTRGVAGYRVLLSGSEVAQPVISTYVFGGLTPATTYTLSVIAADAAGNLSAASSPLVVKTPENIGAPSGLRATGVSPTGFTLSWTEATGLAVAYDVLRDGIVVGLTSSTTFTSAGLPTLNAYTLNVAARDAVGFTVAATPPLVIANAGDFNFSTLGDGISDQWKMANGFSPSDPGVAAADPDGDGKSNLHEFQIGTDPNDYYEGRAVTVTRLSPAGQLGPEDSLSYRLNDALGNPFVNAPLRFTANAGGHKLLLDGAETPATTVTARSNAQGVVIIYLVAGEN